MYWEQVTKNRLNIYSWWNNAQRFTAQ